MADETTTEMLAEIDRDLVEIETAVAELAREALQTNYPQQTETTTEMLAEIEGQPESQPVQVREGRWRTRGGEVRNVTPTPDDHPLQQRFPWWDQSSRYTWRQDGRYAYDTESGFDLLEYVGQIQQPQPEPEPQPEPQPEKVITPDDVAGEALAGVWDQVQAEQQIAELQGQLGEAKRRVVELETLVTDLRTINDAQEKAVRSAGRENTDLQHRLDVVSKEWAEQAATINGLQQQLEAVKAELVRVSHDRYQLQIELDAREQVPTSRDDRFEQGWDAGTARTVETIAEWTEPFRTCGSERLAWMVMQNLPHIMRTLTGLTDED